eukprot:gene9688-biopygen2078
MRTARSGLPPTTREQQDANPTNGRVAPLASASTCTGAPKSITTPGEPGAYLPSGRIVHGWQLLTHYYEKCDGARPGHPAAVHSDPPTDRLTRLPSESRSSVANCIQERVLLGLIGHDAQTDVLHGEPRSAICVQRFDDSLGSAIHTTYRSWLRSSSMHEPRDPPLEVVS